MNISKQLALDLPGFGTINPPGTVPDGGTGTVSNILQGFIELLFLFTILFCLLALIYAGFQWTISAGDKQKIANQRQRIIYAIVGLIVVFLAYMVLNLIGHFFNITLLALPK